MATFKKDEQNPNVLIEEVVVENKYDINDLVHQKAVLTQELDKVNALLEAAKKHGIEIEPSSFMT
jgi:hypothetical protein